MKLRRILDRNRDIIAMFLIMIGLILLVWQHYGMNKEIVISPSNKDWSVFLTDDSLEGGNSQVYFRSSRVHSKENDLEWIITYKLAKGAPYPFATFEIELKDKGFIDLSGYDGVSLDIVANGVSDWFRFHIRSVEPGITKEDDFYSHKYNEIQCNSNSINKDMLIEWSDFAVPSWWGSGLKLDFTKTKVNVKKVKRIQITTAQGLCEGSGSIHIKSITIKGKYISALNLYKIVFAFWIIYAFLFIGVNLLKVKKEKKEAESCSKLDPLTGCLNRRGLYEQADKMHENFKEDKKACSIIFADIDHFKKINDSFGHARGDVVLKGFAEILISSGRDNDIIGRWGGEEFIFVAQGCKYDRALEIGERIRKKTEDSDLGITVSLGVVSFHVDDENLDFLIERADKALYQAKETGRNKVCGINKL